MAVRSACQASDVQLLQVGSAPGWCRATGRSADSRHHTFLLLSTGSQRRLCDAPTSVTFAGSDGVAGSYFFLWESNLGSMKMGELNLLMTIMVLHRSSSA